MSLIVFLDDMSDSTVLTCQVPEFSCTIKVLPGYLTDENIHVAVVYEDSFDIRDVLFDIEDDYIACNCACHVCMQVCVCLCVRVCV